MNPELHTLLLNCDVEGCWECPPDADWARSIAEVANLKPRLESALGVHLHFDQDAQDASFFADLGLLSEQRGPNSLAYEICLRFSWFARLYTIHGHNWESRMNSKAQALLAQEGFTYVPSPDLHEPYDGVNVPFEPGLTWWTRYFDYL